jgi:hypothetical protein
MSNDISYWEEDDQDENDNSSGQVNESKTIKALRAKIKADEAKFSEQSAQLEALAKSERERTVKELLEKKGANPKVARLALKDLSDVTDESVEAWLKDNAEALNLKVADTTNEVETESFDDLTNQDAITSQAVSPGTGNAITAKINSFKTIEEITAWAQSQQK